MISFLEEGHLYESIVQDSIKWISVTTLIHQFKEPFDKEVKAQTCSRKPPTTRSPNKWYGLAPDRILDIWDKESKRASELGTWYHKMREDILLGTEQSIPVYAVEEQQGKRLARDQKLTEGIYPEHIVYLASAGVCGQSDKVTVQNKVHINDYKTNKEIRRRGFKNWEGIYSKLQGPLQHIEDCELNLYALQLSLYMYMILRHNPSLEPGIMTLEHITFEEQGRTEWDYPIYSKNDMGDYIIKNIEYIQVPYMKKEIVSILNWLKEPGNREKTIKH